MTLQRNALARMKSQNHELQKRVHYLEGLIAEERARATAFESSLRKEDSTNSVALVEELKQKKEQIELLKQELEKLKAEYNKVYGADQKIKKDLLERAEDAEAKVNELKVEIRTAKGKSNDDTQGAQAPKRK